MDKKNQSDNSVGDDFKLSHENQPPLIWDNISEELTTSDEDAISTDELSLGSSKLSDVADFNVIKEGFVTCFSTKTPPKFMWDKIEQDLESFVVTDAPSDFSAIKSGFEQNYKKTSIPNFTWADLAEEMDNPKLKEKVEDYSLVKRGFEQRYSAVVVPLFSWADLAERMDNEAALADTPDHYSIIKESFQKQYVAHQPAINTWSELNQQLQAQTHWKKAWILLLTPSFLKKAALFTAVGIFIWGSTFFHLLNKPLPLNNQVIVGYDADDEKSTLDRIKEPILKNTDSRNHIHTTEGTEDQNRYIVVDQTQTNSPFLFPKKEYSTNTKIALNSSKKEHNFKAGSILRAKEIANSPSIPTKSKSLSPLFIDKTTNSNNVSVLGEDDKSTIRNQATLNQEDILKSNLKLLANSSNSSWVGQDIMDIELLDNGLSVLIQKFILDETIPQMEEDNFTLVRQAQKGKEIRFEIGLIGKGGTSILLGQNTFDAWNGSNVTTQIYPTTALGILSNYHFSFNDAVVLGVYPYSSMQQYFSVYDNDGNHQETKINASFFDVTVGYQRTLIRYKNLSDVPSKVYARLDVGLGILTHTKTSIDEQIISTENLYNKFNFSVGFALGNTHEIKKQFVIDYGIIGSIGINNLITTVNPIILEPANLLNIGAYLGVRYIISPRLEPSKKQRQFDWSPPFYIEEPTF